MVVAEAECLEVDLVGYHVELPDEFVFAGNLVLFVEIDFDLVELEIDHEELEFDILLVAELVLATCLTQYDSLRL